MKAPSGERRPPLAVAMEWVSQITTVVAEMVLPGIAGQWLDHRWGTKVIGPIGFGLGLTVGIWHLLAMTRPRKGGPAAGQSNSSGDSGAEGQPGPAKESGKNQN